MSWTIDRRAFVRAVPIGILAAFAGHRSLDAELAAWVEHPEPREGITGAEVLAPDVVAPFGDDVVAVYDMVRAIPEIADGIACYCGCAAMPNYRSLLTCFHAGGMAMGCLICQGEARLAHQRATEGQSLAQIRRAVDARFAR